ncbi:putative toxin-antitoxin system, antitoxin component, ribbon-helix-helix domain protein [delta proteobacterium NaphS2]|nr:putative toxin-antitoxin system, antitoxin component, ribbon-helix-helix domain protein [delta proteobacterium NaphS2]
MAAREFIERHNNIELLKQINEAYEDASETEPMVAMMHSNHFRMVKDQW